MLSDHEAVILEIMTKGEDILPIGAHEAPLLSLAARGFVRKIGNGYRITPDGAAAFKAFDDGEFRKMMGITDADAGPVIEGEAEECS